MTQMTRIALASRPRGTPTPDNFSLETATLPDPGPGQVAVRTIWLSLDPYMRGRMDDAKSYADPVPIGGTMEGGTVGEVIASQADGFAPGDIVVGRGGWASHAILGAGELRKVDPSVAPISTALGVLGMPGMTAWVGCNTIAQMQPGETIVVSAATGAVGSLAGQLAKAKGLRVVGVAGGADKCAYAVEELGFDACLDHRAHDERALSVAIREAAPDGVNVYFENVGGKTLAAVIPAMAPFGRIALCGMIAWYNGQNMDEAVASPKLWRAILVNKLRVQGFIVTDHADQGRPFVAEVAPMVAAGKIVFKETVAEGLDAAAEAFLGLLAGQNFGKQLVRVGADPA